MSFPFLTEVGSDGHYTHSQLTDVPSPVREMTIDLSPKQEVNWAMNDVDHTGNTLRYMQQVNKGHTHGAGSNIILEHN